MATQEQALAAIKAAIKHLGQGNMVSSARMSLEDAVSLLAKGDYHYARLRGMASLSYSVGMFHPAYVEEIKTNSTGSMPAAQG